MKKFALDVTLLILFLLVMSFHFIPKILHEVLGLLLVVAMFGHFGWNIKAFKSLTETTKKRLTMLIDVALIVCVAVIIFTGVCISNHLFNGMVDMKLQRNITIHQLHVSLPFLVMILSGLHLGLHWQGFKHRFNSLVRFNVPNVFSRILVAVLISIGIYGSFINRIGDRLLMQHIFATEATSLPFELFIILMTGIFSIYVFIGYLISVKISR